MKSYKMFLLAALAMVIMLGISACNKESGPTGNSGSIFDAPQWQLQEPDNSPADIVEGTFNSPFDIVAPESDVRFCNEGNGMGGNMMGGNMMGGNMMGGRDGMDKRKFMPLARILRSLQLDEAQIELVKGYMFDFRLCVKDAMMTLRESERTLLAPFNTERRAIMDAYKKGEITREQAAQQLKELNIRVREALKNNDARTTACEAMKECRRLLFESIRSALTTEQQALWDAWVLNQPVMDCTMHVR